MSRSIYSVWSSCSVGEPSDNLIKHLKAHPHDVLLIAEEVPFDEVIELCNTIRNSETSTNGDCLVYEHRHAIWRY